MYILFNEVTIKFKTTKRVWQHKPVISAMRSLRQKDCYKFEARLGNGVNSSQPNLYSRKRKKQKKKIKIVFMTPLIFCWVKLG